MVSTGKICMMWMQISALPIDDTASEVSESLTYICLLPAKQEKPMPGSQCFLSM